MNSIPNEIENQAISTVSKVVGKCLLFLVVLMILMGCAFFWASPVFTWFRNIDIALALAFSVALMLTGVFLLAGILALAPQNVFVRTCYVATGITVSIAIMGAGYGLNQIWQGPFGSWPVRYFLEFLAWIPFAVATSSLSGLLLRFARGWCIQANSKHQALSDSIRASDSRYQLRELFTAIFLVLVSFAVLWMAVITPDNDMFMIVNMAGPVMFLFGAIAIFPITLLFLWVRRYLLWQFVVVAATALLLAPSLGVYFYLANKPFNLGLQFFFYSTEFVVSETMITTLVLAVTTALVALRLLGYSLYVPPKKVIEQKTGYERQLKPHPLD